MAGVRAEAPAKEVVSHSVKRDFPVAHTRHLLEPGPIVLVTSAWKEQVNVMTLGWHTVMEFQPSLVGCLISNANHSFEMIRRSRECVLNVPTADMAATVVRIGNCSGRDVDKFTEFALTPVRAQHVRAPLVEECYASLECRLADASWVAKYNFFVFEVVKAHVAASPRAPKTLHYRGDGEFMIAGQSTRRYRRLFRAELLDA